MYEYFEIPRTLSLFPREIYKMDTIFTRHFPVHLNCVARSSSLFYQANERQTAAITKRKHWHTAGAIPRMLRYSRDAIRYAIHDHVLRFLLKFKESQTVFYSLV